MSAFATAPPWCGPRQNRGPVAWNSDLTQGQGRFPSYSFRRPRRLFMTSSRLPAALHSPAFLSLCDPVQGCKRQIRRRNFRLNQKYNQEPHSPHGLATEKCKSASLGRSPRKSSRRNGLFLYGTYTGLPPPPFWMKKHGVPHHRQVPVWLTPKSSVAIMKPESG